MKRSLTEENDRRHKDGQRDDGADRMLDDAGLGSESSSDESVVDADEEIVDEDDDDSIFLHGRTALDSNQILEPDLSSYECLHFFNTNWPCLSFDILNDDLGHERLRYPESVSLITGTQAEKAKENEIIIVNANNLIKTLEDSESDESDDDEEAALNSVSFPVTSCTNRVRSQKKTHLAASFHEDHKIRLWDLVPYAPFRQLENKPRATPLLTIEAHNCEGYALAWSPFEQKLLSGDNSGKIRLSMSTGSSFVSEKMPYTGHNGSVEDICFSPNEKTVFSSVGEDGEIRIWDLRKEPTNPALSVKASNVDINVSSWNPLVTHLFASGHDDGTFSIWDLRQFRRESVPVAQFAYHKNAITSIQFHHSDDAVVICSSDDGSVTLWDLSVEEDENAVDGVPPQLLFQHVIDSPKEAQWHDQHPGMFVASGNNGWSIAKTISV